MWKQQAVSGPQSLTRLRGPFCSLSTCRDLAGWMSSCTTTHHQTRSLSSTSTCRSLVDPTASVLVQCAQLNMFDDAACIWKQWSASRPTSMDRLLGQRQSEEQSGLVSRPAFCPVANTMCRLLDHHKEELEPRLHLTAFELFRTETLSRMYNPSADGASSSCCGDTADFECPSRPDPSGADPILVENDELGTFTVQPNLTDVNIEDSSFLRSLLLPASIQSIYQRLVFEVVRRLEVHGITYWMTGGTLLGAVRHEGFIPWDDDVDLCVLVDDEKQLQQAFNWPQGIEFAPLFGYKVHAPTSEVLPTPRCGSRFGCFVDLFLMRRQPAGGNLIEQARADARSTWPKEVWDPATLFPLKEYEFSGLKLKGPAHAGPYLDSMYPRWQEHGFIPQNHHGRELDRPVVLPFWQLRKPIVSCLPFG